MDGLIWSQVGFGNARISIHPKPRASSEVSFEISEHQLRHGLSAASLASRWFTEPALRTASDAASAAAARQRIYNSTREMGRMEAFLQPDLRPGVILEIQDLPNELPSDPLFLYRVRHLIDREGGRTQAWFHKGGDSFDPLALLGSLGGALGSLL